MCQFLRPPSLLLNTRRVCISSRRLYWDTSNGCRIQARGAGAILSVRAAASTPQLDRVVACLIGQAGVSLHKQIGTTVNAQAATDRDEIRRHAL